MFDSARWRIPTEIAMLVENELSIAGQGGDPWPALERAHLLSQPWAWAHTRIHLTMLRLALKQRDRREFAGQVIRLAVAGPGSLAGKYPPGNTGRTSMRLTETAPLPADIEDALGSVTAPR